jgi:hypothetical protein
MARKVGMTLLSDPGLDAKNVCGNGRYATSQMWSHIAWAVNGASCTRKRILACQGWGWSSFLAGGSGTARFAGRFHTGPGTTRVSFNLFCAPADSTSTAVTPTISVTIDSGSPSTKTWYTATRNSGASFTPNEIFQALVTFDVADMTTYDWSITENNNARVMAVVVYEERGKVVLAEDGTDNGIATDPSYYFTGAEITETSIDDPWDQIRNLWRRQASVYIADHFQLTDLTSNSATDINPMANSYTSYNAAAPGYWVNTTRQYSYHDNPLVYGVAYAYLEGTAANGAQLKFVEAGATVATLTYNTTPGVFTGTATISIGSLHKVDILMNNGGSGTLECRYLGLYAYET